MSGAQVVTGSCDLNGGVVNQYFTPIESVSAGAQSLRVAIDSDSVRGTVSASNVFLLHQVLSCVLLVVAETFFVGR